MKKLISLILAVTMLIIPIEIYAEDYTTGYLCSLLSPANIIFNSSDYSHDLSSWGWNAQYPDGMSVADNGGSPVLSFVRTSTYTDGGNVTLSDSIKNATSDGEFAAVSFDLVLPSNGEHIITMYSAGGNIGGKELVKFKLTEKGLFPCTTSEQNADNYTSTPIISGQGSHIDLFFIKEADGIHCTYNSGVSTLYSIIIPSSHFSEGLGVIRDFVKFSTASCGLGDLKIYAGDVGTAESTRYMEKLDRGLVAMMSERGVYISWRLLGTEAYDTEFDVYKNDELIGSVSDSTNYIDLFGTISDTYSVAPTNGDRSRNVQPFASNSNYFDIPLSQPDDVLLPDGTYASYEPWDATVGDLDGDGEYEIIQRWDAPRRHAGSSGYTGGLILDAYKLDGTVLWRINLGVNIRCNTEQIFTVYDYNSDGVCEIMAKTAPGSMDGTGRFVTEASLIDDIKNADNSADYRDEYGRVLNGDEYYTLFDGRNGESLDTIYYPIPRGDGDEFYVWGDNYGHRSEKYLDVPAYLDGVHPYIVTWRGIYAGQSKYGPGRTAVAALRVENNRLKLVGRFDTRAGKDGYSEGNEKYIGQGNHNISVGDVDNDGCDEIISGGLCLDDDLSVRWCSYRGHGDALHLGNYDPTTEGLEYMTVHENGGYSTQGVNLDYGMTVFNASSGEELLHVPGTGDTGRGVMANVGSGGFYQVWGSGTYQSNGGSSFTETPLSGQSYNFRIFWDGDTYDELLDAVNSSTNHTPIVTSYDSSSGTMKEIFRGTDTETINTTKSTVALSADILGDWREEIVAVREDMKAIRVFVSPIYTTNKIYTLMHDSHYRQSVAAEHEYYNQPPHIGFYLSGNDDQYDERRNMPDIAAVQYEPSNFTPSIYISSGELQSEKQPDMTKFIDMDGDYFHAYDYIVNTGTTATIGNTSVSLSSVRYAYAVSANPHHASVLRSGVERKDGRFISFAANGDSTAKMSISGKGIVTRDADIEFDFAIPSNYSNNGTSDRGGSDVSISIGDLTLAYSWENKTLSAKNSVIHTFADAADAQRWTNLKASANLENDTISLLLTFADGSTFTDEYAFNASTLSDISFYTSGWGCILIDNVSVCSESFEDAIVSNSDFTAHEFESVGNDFSIDTFLTVFEYTDGVIGLGSADNSAAWYSDLNIALRTTSDGLFEAYNANRFSSVDNVRYEPNKKYNLRIEGNIDTKLYSAYITDENGNTNTIASSYSFRNTAPAVTTLGKLYALGGDGVGGGKFALSSFVYFDGIPSQRVTYASYQNEYLTLYANGALNVYIPTYSADLSLIDVQKVTFDGADTKQIHLGDRTSLGIFIWEKDSATPISMPRILK